MEQVKGREALRCLASTALYVNDMTLADISFSVVEGDTYLAYVPGKNIDLRRKPGGQN
jgi:hypothetical protein